MSTLPRSPLALPPCLLSLLHPLPPHSSLPFPPFPPPPRLPLSITSSGRSSLRTVTCPPNPAARPPATPLQHPPCPYLPHGVPRSSPPASALPSPLPGAASPLPLPPRLFLSPPREVSGLSVCQSFGQSAPELQAAGAIASRAVWGRRPGRPGPAGGGETRPAPRQVRAAEAPSGRRLRPLPLLRRHSVTARSAQVTAPGWGRCARRRGWGGVGGGRRGRGGAGAGAGRGGDWGARAWLGGGVTVVEKRRKPGDPEGGAEAGVRAPGGSPVGKGWRLPRGSLRKGERECGGGQGNGATRPGVGLVGRGGGQGR